MDKKEFTLAVYDFVKLIPPGRATSYGIIARCIGYPTLHRMVGRVLSEIDSEKDIPAHRVVNNQGILSAREAFGPNNEMQKKLEEEGIVVANHKIQNWKTVCWNPLLEDEII